MADSDQMAFRAIYSDVGRPLTFEDMTDRLGGVEALVWASIVPFTDPHNPNQGKVAAERVRNFPVYSLNYNSPLEIVFGISAAVGSVSAAGFAVLRLWDRFQTSRVRTAEAATAVSAYQVVREHMQLGQVGAQENESIRAAASTLLQLESLRRVDQPGG
jgi:hypothetical protein